MNKLTKIEGKISSIDEKISKLDKKKKILISSKNELMKEFNALKISQVLTENKGKLEEIIGQDNFDIIQKQLEVKKL